MKRALVCAMSLAGLFAFSGCIAASVHDNHLVSAKQVVSHEGQVYVVDTETGKSEIVDVSGATPFVPEPRDGDCD